MIEPERLTRALAKARSDLLAERNGQVHWTGELASSPLATATAVSALAVADRGRKLTASQSQDAADCQYGELIVRGLRWLVKTQNQDGGWGDTTDSLSNIATTYLACAAFRLNGVPGNDPGLLDRAWRYIGTRGGIAGLRRRYGRDKTFAAPILTNCALAGMTPWREVSSLPFELACLPPAWFRFLRLPVVSYAIPALVAIGQAKYFHQKPLNPLTRLLRGAAVRKSLELLEKMQPAGGGFLEATPLTSFVVMSLASVGFHEHAVVRRGLDFIVRSARPDGAWPIDTNLATWNTSLSINALAAGEDGLGDVDCLDWLLDCQHQQQHPYTSAAPGGWGWSDLSGAVPDADDTPGALLALDAYLSTDITEAQRAQIHAAAASGIDWLLDLQNRDGGWPTFCRGWGKLPFDRSGSDLTAHVLRAMRVWRERFSDREQSGDENHAVRLSRMRTATDLGIAYLVQSQRADGSWAPLWFGNQYFPEEENPIYGTAKVLIALGDNDLLETDAARRGLNWLIARRNPDGGWGGRPVIEKGRARWYSSVEETAVALEALAGARMPVSGVSATMLQTAVNQGLQWLAGAVERDAHRETSPIGFYFAKLWYHERLYPLIFTVSALGQAVGRLLPRSESKPTSVHH